MKAERKRRERRKRRKINEGEGGNICNIISSIMTHLSLINIDIVISIVRAIDNNPHTNNNNNIGESNNSKLSWNNKHTHTHTLAHTHTHEHTTHSTAIESQKKVAHAASSFTVKWQIPASRDSIQGGSRGNGGSVLVPCRMWACLLRGRALAYWRTDRLPRVVVVVVLLLLLPVEWASSALSSP